MSETLEPKVKETLRSYVRDVKSLNNEAAKRSRFAALIAELFPGTNAVSHYSHGVEKLIRITHGGREKKGRADAYYGNAIIEFEKSLSATLEEAKTQLCEYVAGTWQKDKAATPMLAVASDGLSWIIYRPVLLAGAKPAPETVSLEEVRSLKVGEDTLDSFWLWLTSFLFRDQQIEPTAERFQLDFGAGVLYADSMAALKRAWGKVSGESEARLAFDTWQRYLTVTYGQLTEDTTAKKDKETSEEISELESLFLRHTYLTTIARLLIWAALSQGKSTDDLGRVAKDVISGDYFKSKRLANLVDDDFFHWIGNPQAEKILTATWERLLSHLTEYNLGQVREDILKGVYQELIDPKDRHYLGEYYTPDWLAERVVHELLPENGYKATLDPSCGSGTFLRAVITHFLRHNPEGTDNEKLRLILGNVQGIDIHPVAVTIARATYVLALGKLINAARRPIQIPVYMADSLFLPREVEQNLYDTVGGVDITFGGKKDKKQVVMPDMLIHSPELFDDAIAACSSVAEEHAARGKDSKKTMEKYLAMHVPGLSALLEYPSIIEALWTFTDGLADLIRQKKNSIWSFIIRNSYRPAMLKERFDFIVGNPPWLSYRFISDPEYQDEVKRRAIDRYHIAPKSQKLFAQMELATVFLAHSMATFANADARLGFVMPRAVLSADQHQNLIKRTYATAARFKLTAFWDLWDVSPLFNTPSCVLFAKRDISIGSPKDVLPALKWSGKLPKRDVPWDVATNYLKAQPKSGRVIYLGSRVALSTESGASAPTKPSKYQAAFKQGATIVPRNVFFVSVNLNGSVDPNATYWAKTDPEQAALAKKPYQDVKMSGDVEGRFIYCTAVARHVLPFGLLPPSTVVLPLQQKDGRLEIITSEKMMSEGYREFGKWMSDAESIWNTKREDKADKQDLYERLDYQKELTKQNLSQRYLVLYNADGMNISATFFDRQSHPLPFVLDRTVYWAAFTNVEEPDYLCAVLNSETVNASIKPFQSTGLLGERHVHKKLLELPIPTYDPEKSLHKELAKLGSAARSRMSEFMGAEDFPTSASTARQRGLVRKLLNPELTQINDLVGRLFK